MCSVVVICIMICSAVQHESLGQRQRPWTRPAGANFAVRKNSSIPFYSKLAGLTKNNHSRRAVSRLSARKRETEQNKRILKWLNNVADDFSSENKNKSATIRRKKALISCRTCFALPTHCSWLGRRERGAEIKRSDSRLKVKPSSVGQAPRGRLEIFLFHCQGQIGHGESYERWLLRLLHNEMQRKGFARFSFHLVSSLLNRFRRCGELWRRAVSRIQCNDFNLFADGRLVCAF